MVKSSSSGEASEISSPAFLTALCSGAVAGLTTDLALYPIDTLKTRYQSSQGFVKAGGFNGVYKGVTAVGAGSAPGAALFFVVYERMKQVLADRTTQPHHSHMLAACAGEVSACLVRVPTEVVKSKMQTGAEGCSTLAGAINTIISETGGASNLYRGFGVTIMREIPFALIQFPIYEKLKSIIGSTRGSPASPIESAACGSVGGAIAAAVTTPLDVVKTRLMLGADKANVPYTSALDVVARVTRDEGSATLFSGIQPRVVWIGFGGFVFFGAYEAAKSVFTTIT